LGCAIGTAAQERQLGRSIHVPGLATILPLANLTKRSQAIAQDARVQAAITRQERDLAEDANRFKSSA
jgi:hypothetical protein